MYIKIYFDDKAVFLCDGIDTALQPLVHQDDSVFIDVLNTHTIKSIFHELKQPHIKSVVFYHADLNTLKQKFFKKFKLLKAAGGLIMNDKKEILFMLRKKKWDLPKGKIELNETPEMAAIREVKEETGLKNLKNISPLITTWHTYTEGSRLVLKETFWFRMSATGNQLLIPQTEEEIEIIKWIKREALASYITNSYPSIEDVIKAVAP